MPPIIARGMGEASQGRVVAVALVVAGKITRLSEWSVAVASIEPFRALPRPGLRRGFFQITTLKKP